MKTRAEREHTRLPLGLMGALLAIVLAASEASGQDAQEQEASAQQSEESTPPTAEPLLDADGAVIAEAETDEESNARFIPSEEISQDFGVSFPVDI